MECNKEEAFRAKEIALKKLEVKDYVGARKFAIKAQQLHQDMENISQMICVCDVHCSAERNKVGNDSDWYGILQIEKTADDQLIKKQYRKFALLLHPDKNKFAGAEAAFKLIGEAQRVLLDKEKRSLYDLKCRTSSKFVRQNHPAQQASRNFNVTKTSRVQINVSSKANFQFNATNQHSNQQAQSGANNGNDTFWTQCPFCRVRYEFYKEVFSRALNCQSCSKPFIAYDVLASGVQPGYDATQTVFPGKNFQNVFVNKAGSEAMNKQASCATFQSKQNADASQSQNGRQKHQGHNKVEQHSDRTRKVKRGKIQEEYSSESFTSESSLESEDVEFQPDSAQQFDNDADRCTRRSSRNKRPVSYNENVSDNEETMNPPKKANRSGSWGPTTEVDDSEKRQQPFFSASATCKESSKGEYKNSNGSDTVFEPTKKRIEADDYLSASSPESPEPELYECPDPEFCDFDKLREEKCFEVGQVWAAYDTVDAMPRFYAKIRKIYTSSKFKLRITWLEPNPDDPLGFDWSIAQLPFSCGKFMHGITENTEDRLMFSHQVILEKDSSKDSVLIYPRVGETWALFKNWDAKWHLIPDFNKKFEFEFVEVLSDFDETVGIRVSQLGKLKGFASVFCRKSMMEIQIPPTEILKFSHRVPSIRLSGKERENVPKDSFELDPASITMNLEEISLPQSNGDINYVDLSSEDEEIPRESNLNGDVNL